MELKTNSLRSISILLVEDDEVTLELQSSILAMKFPDVMLYTAINGRLGLELFNARSPDIVLTDINMSEMCGVQMTENIRAIKPEAMIITITGKSGDTNVIGKCIKRKSDGKMVEFDHVIVKPVDMYELCGVIEQYIGEIEQRMF
jgi:response regulator RpfG family c-di-GMP phosphodiesterase